MLLDKSRFHRDLLWDIEGVTVMNKKKLIREQLEATLGRLSPLRNVISPPKGWIRAIRNALGMTAKQLAGRLGVAQQAVARIEKDELTGSVTIKTMRRVAESLDCAFVYGFVPRSSLETTLRKQAQQLAARRLARASQTMALENQALSKKENEKVLSEMVSELVDTLPPNLWNES
ncbi:MAG: mobile mystery protein A [Lentisphaerales bacterium]|jgi:predicted DNA-binding mobile mystery protein A|nr:MAG: mobile mystery protein A [Lentisphaerales bacterium]